VFVQGMTGVQNMNFPRGRLKKKENDEVVLIERKVIGLML
jgi:hypothetical protein